MAQSQGSKTSKSGKTTVTLDFKGENGIVLGLEACNQRAPINLHNYMQNKVPEIENHMKTHHPWKNRTHKAEEGLHVDVIDDFNNQQVSLELKHSDIVWPWYGYYLEHGTGDRSGNGRGNSRPYPILEPTQRLYGPRLLNDLNLSELYRFTKNPKA